MGNNVNNKLSPEQKAEDFVSKNIERFFDKVLDHDENPDGDLIPFLNRQWFEEVLQETYLSSHAASKADARRWIPITEDLPREDEDVFVLVDYAKHHVAYYYLDIEGFPIWVDVNNEVNRVSLNVTHWMPLPALPTAPKEGEK